LVLYRRAGERARQMSTESRKSSRRSRGRELVIRRRSSLEPSPSRYSRAIVRKDEIGSAVDREEPPLRRREEPKYQINYLPSTITNAVDRRGTFNYIFYVPEDIFESLKAPVRADQHPADPAEGNGATNHVPGDTEARRPSSGGEARIQGDEGQTEAAEPAWKVDRNEVNQQEPPPPVFFWPTGSAKQQHSNGAPATVKGRRSQPSDLGNAESTTVDNVDGNEGSGNQVRDLKVLSFILNQIHKNLTEGNRVSAHTIGGLSEKEAPIYKNLAKSSQGTTLDRLASFSGARFPDPQPEGEIMSGRDFAPRAKLCFDILVELLEFFLPRDFPSEVVEKFWSALDTWIRGLEQLVSVKNAPFKNTKHHPDPTRPLDSYYVVNAESAPRDSQESELKVPEDELDYCSKCSQRKAYPLLGDALLHLRQKHFTSAEVSEKDLQEWIRRGDQVDAFQLQCDAKRLADTVLEYCSSLRAMKGEIVAGVCRGGRFDSTIYRLPTGLVKAFERILMMIAYSGYAASAAYVNYRESPGKFHSFIEYGHIQHIIELGSAAEAAFEEAKTNLMLMSRVSEYSSSIQYDTVGPEFLLILLLADLKDRATRRHKLNLIGLYQNQLDKLVSDQGIFFFTRCSWQ